MENNFLKSQTQTANIPKKKPVEELPMEKSQEEVEQSPAENSGPKVEPVKNRLAQERRKQTIEIEFDGIKIPLETESYDFEYPKHIQKETGILGYERTKISNQAITDFIKKYYLNKYNINVEDYGFENIELIKDFEEKHKERRKSRPRTEDGFYTEEYQYSEQYKTDELLSEISYGPLKEIIHSMSNGEYPTKCFNHIFSSYVNDEEQKIAYYDEFKRSNFFLQKIYDLASKERLGKNSFYHKGISDQYSIHEVFEKSTNAFFGTRINNRERKDPYLYFASVEALERDNRWAFTELNFTTSDFWNRDKDINGVCVGFSMNDDLLKEYLEKSLRYLSNITEDNGPKSKLTWVLHDNIRILNGTTSIIWNLVHFNKKIQNLLFEDIQENQPSLNINMIRTVVDSAFSEIEQQTSFPVSEFLSKNSNHSKDTINKINKNLNIKYENNGFNYCKTCLIKKILETREQLLASKHFNKTHPIYREVHVPVFINHDNLPQLAWGHAKYAHYMNEKGFNFFKFKHAEHLPEPQKVKHEE